MLCSKANRDGYMSVVMYKYIYDTEDDHHEVQEDHKDDAGNQDSKDDTQNQVGDKNEEDDHKMDVPATNTGQDDGSTTGTKKDDDEESEEEYERELLSIARTQVPMPELYAKVNPLHNARIQGGVAMIRVGLSYQATAGTYDSKEELPHEILPELKIKLYGFHAMCCAGSSIEPITYHTKRGFTIKT